MKDINFKGNRALFTGALMSAIFFCIKGSGLALPEMIEGFIMGIALAGYGLGLYGMKHDISKLREWKKTLLHKL